MTAATDNKQILLMQLLRILMNFLKVKIIHSLRKNSAILL